MKLLSYDCSKYKSDIFDKIGLTSLAKRERGEKIENKRGKWKITNRTSSGGPIIVHGTVLYPGDSICLHLNFEELKQMIFRGLKVEYVEP